MSKKISDDILKEASEFLGRDAEYYNGKLGREIMDAFNGAVATCYSIHGQMSGLREAYQFCCTVARHATENPATPIFWNR